MVLLKNLPKKTQGRKRIEIKKLENLNSKQVTFSKRRAGIFKKAAELSVLCGADVAVIVFSTAGKVFCYGHPSVDTILDWYCSGVTPAAVSDDTAGDKSPNRVPVAEFNKEYMEAIRELEEQKKRVAEVKEAAKMKKVVMGVVGGCGERFWWEDESVDLDALDVQEVEHYLIALEDVRKQVAARLHEMKILNGTLNPGALPPIPAVHRLCHLPMMTNGFSGHGGQFGGGYHGFGI
ncbi:agamous-like MADS-box protein AGL62 [Pyrus x bretschneideri]|uniref:agamous-like MADS-box protein AGL62 n=1 Tax=Pyrus x bretschneideri TaxID=225117 RepID=UPI0020301DD8|nr:agamous-like MADS-box protein AGL62 [Pyrus x bretschneideri]